MLAIIFLTIWKLGCFISCLLYLHHLTHKSCVYSFLYNVHLLSFPSLRQTRRKDWLGNSVLKVHKDFSRSIFDISTLINILYLLFSESSIVCMWNKACFTHQTDKLSLSSACYRLVPTAFSLDCNIRWSPDKTLTSVLCVCFHFKKYHSQNICYKVKGLFQHMEIV